MLRWVVSFVVVASALVVVSAQVGAPTLTEVQRLQLQNLAQQMEIAQLRAQAAQRDFDAARERIAQLAKEWEVEGYTLDLATLSYVPKPATPQGEP